jgi:hypothetical protein
MSINLGIARDRKFGLGYGTLKNSPQTHQKLNNSFPYYDDFEEIEYSEEDEILADKIANKMILPSIKSDPLRRADTSSFADPYYVKEIAKGISPISMVYKSRDSHLEHSPSPASSYYGPRFKVNPTPSNHSFDREPLEDDSEEYIYNLEDSILLSLRECISLIIMEVI